MQCSDGDAKRNEETTVTCYRWHYLSIIFMHQNESKIIWIICLENQKSETRMPASILK